MSPTTFGKNKCQQILCEMLYRPENKTYRYKISRIMEKAFLATHDIVNSNLENKSHLLKLVRKDFFEKLRVWSYNCNPPTNIYTYSKTSLTCIFREAEKDLKADKLKDDFDYLEHPCNGNGT